MFRIPLVLVYVIQRSKKGRVFILIAPGFEEADVSAMTRTLRRSGLPVAVVGLAAGPIRGNYGLVLTPDVILSETEPEFLSAVVLPGGIQGAQRLNAEPRVHALLRQVISQEATSWHWRRLIRSCSVFLGDQLAQPGAAWLDDIVLDQGAGIEVR